VPASGILSNPGGFYVLSAEGQLGTAGSAGEFVMDVKLTRQFFDYLAGYLKHYLANPDGSGFRLAVLFRAHAPRQWGTETMLLEHRILRELYPVGGPIGGELTNFQRKNAEKSVYRGMELLLEYRNDQDPETPVFCPVLFNGGRRLADYAELPRAQGTSDESAQPVLEVLNLLAGIPAGRRAIPAIKQLMLDVHARLIRKDARRGEGYTLIDKAFERTGDGEDVEDPFAEPDKGAVQKFSIVGTSSDGLNQWLAKPYRFLKPDEFRFFHMFREIGVDRLNELAEHCPAYRAPAGAPLLGKGTNDEWNFFLLEGQLELEAADGARKVIQGGADATRSPVCHLKPRMYGVRALTQVTFLWIDNARIDKVCGS